MPSVQALPPFPPPSLAFSPAMTTRTSMKSRRSASVTGARPLASLARGELDTTRWKTASARWEWKASVMTLASRQNMRKLQGLR